MKLSGIALMVIGCLWALVAFNSNVTVTSDSYRSDLIYIPSQTVNNVGKMDERRNHLMMSSLVVIVGMALFAVGAFREPKTQVQSRNTSSMMARTRKCPHCAEFVKAEAKICRFCQRELPPVESPTHDSTATASTGSSSYSQAREPSCWTCDHYTPTGIKEPSKGACSLSNKNTTAWKVCDAYAPKIQRT